MPSFSAINAAGDEDGRRTTAVAPSVTVACSAAVRALRLVFRTCRSTIAKRARVAVSRMPDAKLTEDTVALHGNLTREAAAAAAAAAATVSCPCRMPCGLASVSCVMFRVFGCLGCCHEHYQLLLWRDCHKLLWSTAINTRVLYPMCGTKSTHSSVLYREKCKYRYVHVFHLKKSPKLLRYGERNFEVYL